MTFAGREVEALAAVDPKDCVYCQAVPSVPCALHRTPTCRDCDVELTTANTGGYRAGVPDVCDECLARAQAATLAAFLADEGIASWA